jgi:hypothetical protein
MKNDLRGALYIPWKHIKEKNTEKKLINKPITKIEDSYPTGTYLEGLQIYGVGVFYFILRKRSQVTTVNDRTIHPPENHG